MLNEPDSLSPPPPAPPPPPAGGAPPPPPPPPPPPLDAAADSEIAFLLRYLQFHEVACPLCKYNLRNLTVPRCPECGREIKLTVGMAEPYLLPWILGTIFMAMAASIGVVFLIACVLFGPPPLDPVSLRDVAMLSCMFWGILAIPLTIVLVALRRRVFRADRAVQWSLAGAIFFINSVLLVLFFANAR
jgi:hypothetical protein